MAEKPAKPAPVDPYLGLIRAVGEQGLGMGWGDEAEAWLRSKAGEGSYEDLLKQIQGEYGAYSEKYPWTSFAGEFAGGALPTAVSMLIPGGQAPAAANIARTAGGALTRLATSPTARTIGTAAVTGGISGAGSARPDERGSGALTGATVGTLFGIAIPPTMTIGRGAWRWIIDRAFPNENAAAREAKRKMAEALAESGMSPRDIEARINQDRAVGVGSSVVANVDENLADLAEAVAQRTGSGTKKVTSTLGKQAKGQKGRVAEKLEAGLKPEGDFFEREQDLTTKLRNKAGNVYDAAYAHGEVNDPAIMEALEDPDFKTAYQRALNIIEKERRGARLRGEDESKYQLKPIFIGDEKGNLKLVDIPDVRTLDYIKRGLDGMITAGYQGQGGLDSAQATALKQLRNLFVNKIDELVPEYKLARSTYKGDMEVIDALNAGRDSFSSAAPKEIEMMWKDFTPAEKAAYRTGVSEFFARKFGRSAKSANRANEIINAEDTSDKLRILFDNDSEFNLFKTALEREAQMFEQVGRILGSSRTGKRKVITEKFEETEPVGEAISKAVKGNWFSGIADWVSRATGNEKFTSEVADKLSDMLMAKDPHEVSAAVDLLEEYAKEAYPATVRQTRGRRAVATGAAVAAPIAPPATETEPESIEDRLSQRSMDLQGLPDVEQIYEEWKKKRDEPK